MTYQAFLQTGSHYCFLSGLGEAVFAISPMNGEGERIHPITARFQDLLRLLLSCGDVAVSSQDPCFDLSGTVT